MMRRAVAVVVIVARVVTGCGPTDAPDTGPTEDTRDETTIQFHEIGQLQYGKWYYAPDGNAACRWFVEQRRTDDDAAWVVREQGTAEDAVRVRAEKPGYDVRLRFNRACGQFRER